MTPSYLYGGGGGSILSRCRLYIEMSPETVTEITPGPRLNRDTIFPGMEISIMKIRRPWDPLIFIMGIPIMVFILRRPLGMTTWLFHNRWWSRLKVVPREPFCMVDYRFAPSQWETALFCNDVSHWMGASLESALALGQRPSKSLAWQQAQDSWISQVVQQWCFRAALVSFFFHVWSPL